MQLVLFRRFVVRVARRQRDRLGLTVENGRRLHAAFHERHRAVELRGKRERAVRIDVGLILQAIDRRRVVAAEDRIVAERRLHFSLEDRLVVDFEIPERIRILVHGQCLTGGQTVPRVRGRRRRDERVAERVDVVSVLVRVRLAAEIAHRRRRRVREAIADFRKLGLTVVVRVDRIAAEHRGRLIERIVDVPRIRGRGRVRREPGLREAVDGPRASERRIPFRVFERARRSVDRIVEHEAELTRHGVRDAEIRELPAFGIQSLIDLTGQRSGRVERAKVDRAVDGVVRLRSVRAGTLDHFDVL